MAIHEIKVTPLGEDPLGREVAHEAARTLGFQDIDIRTARIYRVQGASDQEAHLLADNLFADPISERASVNPAAEDFANPTIEVAYRPGVMNPETGSIVMPVTQRPSVPALEGGESTFSRGARSPRKVTFGFTPVCRVPRSSLKSPRV